MAEGWWVGLLGERLCGFSGSQAPLFITVSKFDSSAPRGLMRPEGPSCVCAPARGSAGHQIRCSELAEYSPTHLASPGGTPLTLQSSPACCLPGALHPPLRGLQTGSEYGRFGGGRVGSGD